MKDKSPLLSPTWEDFIPEFDNKTLIKRLGGKPYNIATLLYPPNMSRSLETTAGRKRFLSFYSKDFETQRRRTAETVDNIGGVNSASVKAVSKVPREIFVDKDKQTLVYWNGVSWINRSNGLTPPWLAAYAATQLKVKTGNRVLGIGAGNGYSSAIFNETMKCKGEVCAIDIDEEPLKNARNIFKILGYDNIKLERRDGLLGWPDDVKFDAIWSSLTAPSIPDVWVRQLKEGGRLGFFRPYNRREYDIASKTVAGWKNDYKTFQEYLDTWWEDVCLATYEKRQGKLVETTQLYRLFNVPYVSPIISNDKDKQWEEQLGSIERKLINFAKKEGL
jgi:protein-L-isoaspartate(D-aspartate) O-methyltransferase